MYRSDDVVTTADGKRHRVIYQSGDELFCKSADCKGGKAYKISTKRVIAHQPRGTK